jgi:hypothetical protein
MMQMQLKVGILASNNFGFCQVNTGDNHAGYIGFRNPTNTNLLADDGAMNIVVGHWRS